MNGEEIINLITIIISAVALIPNVFLIVFQYFSNKKGIDTFINYLLCICCLTESVYYFLGINSGILICQIKGVLMIIADTMRMSIGLFKLLLLRNENYSNLGIDKDPTTQDEFLSCMTCVFTIILPIILGLASLLLGNISYTSTSNCYPYNTGYKLIIYMSSTIYYFFFFFILWEIVVKTKFYQEKLAYTLKEGSLSYASINQTQTPIFNTLVWYGIVQALNFFLLLMFLVYLFLERFTEESFILHRFVGSTVYQVCALCLQSFLFLLFLIVYGYHSIKLIDIKNFLSCNRSIIKTYSDLSSLKIENNN